MLYDADCGFCRWSLGWVLRADRRRVLRPVKLGTPAADELLSDITPEQRMSSWHLVAPDGTRQSAGAAAPPLLLQLPGGQLPARLLASAPEITERAYQWVVKHRSKFGKLIAESSKQRADRLISSRSRPPVAAR